jgi:hypothetical protein
MVFSLITILEIMIYNFYYFLYKLLYLYNIILYLYNYFYITRMYVKYNGYKFVWYSVYKILLKQK